MFMHHFNMCKPISSQKPFSLFSFKSNGFNAVVLLILQHENILLIGCIFFSFIILIIRTGKCQIIPLNCHTTCIYKSEVASLFVLCRCIQPQVLCLNPSPFYCLVYILVSQHKWLNAIGQTKASSLSSAITRDTHGEAGISKNYCATNSGGPEIELRSS
jgi:hypothetical protein